MHKPKSKFEGIAKESRRLFLPTIILLLGAGFTYVVFTIRSDMVPARVTSSSEAILTQKHGVEVKAAIEYYEENWLSLIAHTDPSFQSTVAIDPYLWYWGYARRGQEIYNEPTWWVTKSANITYLRVVEYTSERFKAVANIEQTTDEITPQEEFIRSLPSLKFCRLYLFVRKEGAWKLANLFDMTIERNIERDWENFVAWERQNMGEQIMGELPSEKCPYHQ